jgi:alkylhydroperoxidase family enzyme
VRPDQVEFASARSADRNFERQIILMIHIPYFRVGAMLALVFASLSIRPNARADDPKPPTARESPQQAEATLNALAEAWPDRPEWLDMYTAILQGSQLGPNDGWFRRAVAQTRFAWDATRKRLDRNGDDKIARGEFSGSDADFSRLDRDHDQALTASDFNFSPHALSSSPGSMLFYMFDRDGNGKITREELEVWFNQLDTGKQDFLSLMDLEEAFRPATMMMMAGRSGTNRSGPSKETLIRGLFRQEIGSLQPGPALGESAPDFTLKLNDSSNELTLSKLIGQKPVVLVFGNFTCGPFRVQSGNVEKLYRMYKDRAHFVMVYVREAHPADGWTLEVNDRVGVSLPQPRSYEERVAVAQTCGSRLGLGLPMLVDTIDDAVGARYSGMPSRLYLIDQDGKVAYKSGRGPFGFKPAELEHSLILLLDEIASTATAKHQARVPLPSDEEAWKMLPAVEAGGGQPLPTWARALARTLPKTTAAMLDLDRLHRTRSPLDPILRAKMRWVAANANQCEYSRAYAVADLRRAGLDEPGIASLAGDRSALPEAERAALEFADKMTREANRVTDAEVARLVEYYGEPKVVGMVLLLAFANFQDRLLLALDVPLEDNGPLAPLQVSFAKNAPAPVVPARVPPEGNGPSVPTRVDDDQWVALDFDVLQKNLELQRSNTSRIRVPSFEEVLKVLPEGYAVPKRPVRIQWSLVCMGFQPELAIGWSACASAFREEAKQDRVFEESLFWVVTRTIHCFY